MAVAVTVEVEMEVVVMVRCREGEKEKYGKDRGVNEANSPIWSWCLRLQSW
jgi:hypothetical protein